MDPGRRDEQPSDESMAGERPMDVAFDQDEPIEEPPAKSARLASWEFDFQKFDDRSLTIALQKATFRLFGCQGKCKAKAAKEKLLEEQPEVGMCTRQWGAHDIAFRCRECESDKNCVQCFQCFSKANHEGHHVTLIRTDGGSCDCGDPASWKPEGNCTDHCAMPEKYDGPEILDLLYPDMRSRAEEVIFAVVQAIDELLGSKPITPPRPVSASAKSRALPRASPKFGSVIQDSQRALRVLRRRERLLQVSQEAWLHGAACQIWKFLQELGASLSLRHLIIEQLTRDRLLRWIDVNLSTSSPSPLHVAMHTFFLFFLQSSSRFKRRFALIFAEQYDRIALEGPSDGPFSVWSEGELGTLSVQIFTIKPIVLELVREHALLENLFRKLKSLLEELVALEPSSSWEKRADMVLWQQAERYLHDIGDVLHQPEVCQYVLETDSTQEIILQSLNQLWRMNPQRRREPAEEHVLYESDVGEWAITMELTVLQKLTPLCDYCLRPEVTLDSLKPWYSAIVKLLSSMQSFQSSLNSTDNASFHLPHQRLLIRCISFDLLTVGDRAWLDMFPEGFLVTMLLHAVRTIRFATDIRDGAWKFNGQTMNFQEAASQPLAKYDLMTIQFCIVMLSRHAANTQEVGKLLTLLWTAALCDDGDELPLEPSLRALQMSCSNVSLTALNASEMLRHWRALLSDSSQDSTSCRKMRIELFWELLARSLNEMLHIGFVMCSPKLGSPVNDELRDAILQRYLIQLLACKSRSFADVMAKIPSQLQASEEHVMNALCKVAERADSQKPFVLSNHGWQLYDGIPPFGGLHLKDHQNALETALRVPSATLCGPRRSDSLPCMDRFQDQVVAALCDAPLANMVLDFVSHKCATKLMSRSCEGLWTPQLDIAFNYCLKVIDIIYDVNVGDGSTALACNIFEPVKMSLTRLGQGVQIDGGEETEVGTLGLEQGTACYEVHVAGSDPEVRLVQVENLHLPRAYATSHDMLLDRLQVLQSQITENQFQKRVLMEKSLPQRIRERLSSLSKLGEREEATTASSSMSIPDDSRRRQLASVRERQRSMLQRMQQKQSAALGTFTSDEPTALSEQEEHETGPQCATCREGASESKPLSVVAHVAPSSTLQFYGGPNSVMPRFVSCGHLLHAECGERHVTAIHAATNRNRFDVNNAASGEFLCPVCRSLSNCNLPYVPDSIFHLGLEPADVVWTFIDHVNKDIKAIRLRHTGEMATRAALLPFLQLAGSLTFAAVKVAGGSPDSTYGGVRPRGTSSLIVNAMVSEVQVTGVVSPMSFVDYSSSLPLYVTLLRNAVLLRCTEPLPDTPTVEGEHILSDFAVKESSPILVKALSRIESPLGVSGLDLKVALAEVLVDALSSNEGLTMKSFSALVDALLELRALQLLEQSFPFMSCAAEAGLSPAPQEGLLTFINRTLSLSLKPGGTALENVLYGLTSFLRFAAWLCAAVWHIPSKERTHLAYLDAGDEGSFEYLASLLRIGVGNTEEILFSTRTNALVRLPSLVNPSPEPRRSLVPFMELPVNYFELVKLVYNKPCTMCKCRPVEPALCLMCGAVVCMEGTGPLQITINNGHCIKHAKRCAAGQCLFILPYSALILAVSAPLCYLWEDRCPYVDSNGDPNPHLSRPCMMQLRLDERKLTNLRQIVSMAGIRKEIISSMARDDVAGDISDESDSGDAGDVL